MSALVSRSELLKTWEKNWPPITTVVVDERGDWVLTRTNYGDAARFDVLLLGTPHCTVDVFLDRVKIDTVRSSSVVPRWIMTQLLAEIALIAAVDVKQDLNDGKAEPEPA
jgi:hypothetical protein